VVDDARNVDGHDHVNHDCAKDGGGGYSEVHGEERGNGDSMVLLIAMVVVNGNSVGCDAGFHDNDCDIDFTNDADDSDDGNGDDDCICYGA